MQTLVTPKNREAKFAKKKKRLLSPGTRFVGKDKTKIYLYRLTCRMDRKV